MEYLIIYENTEGVFKEYINLEIDEIDYLINQCMLFKIIVHSVTLII